MPIFGPSTYGRAPVQPGALPGGQQLPPNSSMRQIPHGLGSVNPAAPMPNMSMVPPPEPAGMAPPQQQMQSMPQPQIPQLNNQQAAQAVTKLQNPFSQKSNPQAAGSNRMIKGLFSQVPGSNNNMKA